MKIRFKEIFKKYFNKKEMNSNMYDVNKDWEKDEKIKKISFLDRIKYIRFKSKNSNKNMNTEKIKNTGLIIIAVLLIGIGYSNFSENKQMTGNAIETYSKSTDNIGDVQLVSSNSVSLVENEDVVKSEDKLEKNVDKENMENSSKSDDKTIKENDESGAIVANSENENILNSEKIKNEQSENASSISEENKAYFSKLKMDRNDMYSKNIEAYQKIIDATSISNEQKAIAIQEIEKINNMQNAISIAEELIKLKGFEDVIIYKNSNSVSVIVRISALSMTQVAQIQNIVSKQLNVDVSSITISNK